MTTDKTPSPRQLLPGEKETVLAAFPRIGGEVHVVHRERGVHDALVLVSVRPGFPNFNLVINFRHVADLRAALERFEQIVREKHAARPIALPRTEYRGHMARIPNDRPTTGHQPNPNPKRESR